MNEQRCSQTYYKYFYRHTCAKLAKVERDGKPYCKIHDPEYIAKKQAERQARWEAEGELKIAKWKREKRMKELAHLIPLRIVSQNCRGFECEKELHDLAVEYLDLEKENG